MAKKNNMNEIDGVDYRRAKLWQIILYAANSLCGTTVFMLINQVSYAASIGFGIGTALIFNPYFGCNNRSFVRLDL